MTRHVQLMWIAIVGISLASASALAERTKIALSIEGDSSAIGLRKAVVGAFDDDNDVQFVSQKKTTRIIEQLGIGEVKSTNQAKTVAKKLAVHAVVQGEFDESDHTLTLTVYTKGKKGSFTVEADAPKSAKFRKAVRKKMLAKIEVASADEETDETSDEAPAKKVKNGDAKKTAKAETKKHDDEEDDVAAADAKNDSAKKTAKTDAKTHDDDEEDEAATADDKPAKHKKVASRDDADEEAGRVDDEEPTASAHARGDGVAPASGSINLAAIRIDLGMSMTGRTLKFESTAVENAPSSYHAKPVPGGHLAGEIYPAAFKDPTRVSAGFGIAGDFDQARSFTALAADGATQLAVTERRYSVGARFRLAIGHRATSPTLTLGAGYGVRAFAIDHSQMATNVPNVEYRTIDPSLMARVPIGSRAAVFVGGRALLPLSAGAIAEADQYGRAHVTAGSATAGVDIVIGRHLALRVAGEGTQMNLKFLGQGMMSNNLDGDPTTIDVQRARDRYYGGEATLAVTY